MNRSKVKHMGGSRYLLGEKENPLAVEGSATMKKQNADALEMVVTLKPEEIKRCLIGEFEKAREELKNSQGEEAVRVFDRLMKVVDLLTSGKPVEVPLTIEWPLVKEHVIARGHMISPWFSGMPGQLKEDTGATKQKAS